MQKCAACQDLPTLQFWSKSDYPFWSYCPFLSNFQNFNTFRPLFQKLYEIDVKVKLQTCSACQDLPTLQFWSTSDYPSWSYCPFFIKCFKILIFFVLYFKNYKRSRLSLNCKHVQHVKIYLPCNFEVNLITHLRVIALFSSI